MEAVVVVVGNDRGRGGAIRVFLFPQPLKASCSNDHALRVGIWQIGRLNSRLHEQTANVARKEEGGGWVPQKLVPFVPLFGGGGDGGGRPFKVRRIER